MHAKANELNRELIGVNVYLKTSMGLQVNYIDKMDFLIGSSAEADIVIKHPSIAKKHIYFSIKNDQMYFFDMSQGGKVRISDKKINETGPILYREGAIIKIGSAQIQLSIVQVKNDPRNKVALAENNPVQSEAQNELNRKRKLIAETEVTDMILRAEETALRIKMAAEAEAQRIKEQTEREITERYRRSFTEYQHMQEQEQSRGDALKSENIILLKENESIRQDQESLLIKINEVNAKKIQVESDFKILQQKITEEEKEIHKNIIQLRKEQSIHQDMLSTFEEKHQFEKDKIRDLQERSLELKDLNVQANFDLKEIKKELSHITSLIHTEQRELKKLEQERESLKQLVLILKSEKEGLNDFIDERKQRLYQYIEKQEKDIEQKVRDANLRAQEILTTTDQEAAQILDRAKKYEDEYRKQADKLKKEILNDARIQAEHYLTQQKRIAHEKSDQILSKLAAEENKKLMQLESMDEEISSHLKKAQDQSEQIIQKGMQEKESLIASARTQIEIEKREFQSQQIEKLKQFEHECQQNEIKEFKKRKSAVKDICKSIEFGLEKKLELCLTHGMSTEQLSEIIKQASDSVHQIITQKSVDRSSLFHTFLPKDLHRTRAVQVFWIKSSAKFLLASFIVFTMIMKPQWYLEFKESIAQAMTPEESATDIYIKEILAARKNKPNFSPEQTKGYKDRYTDNILYTQNYLDLITDSNFQKKWIVHLNKFILNDLQLSEKIIVEYRMVELKMIRELLEIRSKIKPKNSQSGINEMRTHEAQYQKDLSALFETEENWFRFLNEKKIFFDNYQTP